jgi:hypothetical protein
VHLSGIDEDFHGYISLIFVIEAPKYLSKGSGAERFLYFVSIGDMIAHNCFHILAMKIESEIGRRIIGRHDLATFWTDIVDLGKRQDFLSFEGGQIAIVNFECLFGREADMACSREWMDVWSRDVHGRPLARGARADQCH